MTDQITLPLGPHLCSLFEVWEITEMKDGAIFDTRDTGEVVWVPLEVPYLRQVGNKLYVSPSEPKIERRNDWVIPQ